MKKTSTSEKKPGATERAAEAPARGRGRPKNTTLTRDVILRAAEKVFALAGYGSSRIEKIAAAAKCNESLIYSYFSSKEALFVAVLENAYGKMLQAEQGLDLDLDQPLAALEAIVLFPWQYYRANPELITLLAAENLHKAKHLNKAELAGKYFAPAIAVLDRVISAGVREGVFRQDIDVANLYVAIMALGYFYVSNRYTLSAFLGKNLMAEQEIEQWGLFITGFVLDAVRAPKS
jgi:AcrR family transcriptional regulator